MTNEHSLLQPGPLAIIAKVANDRNINLHVLAQACGRNSRMATTMESFEAWTEAAIACYELAASLIEDPVARQGLLLGSGGLRAAYIIRTHGEGEASAHHLQELRSWFKDGIHPFSSPEELRRSLRNPEDPAHEQALLAQERLRIAFPLQADGYLGDFSDWLDTTL